MYQKLNEKKKFTCNNPSTGKLFSIEKLNSTHTHQKGRLKRNLWHHIKTSIASTFQIEKQRNIIAQQQNFKTFEKF